MESAPRQEPGGPVVWATLGVRGFGLVMIVLGGWQLLARLAELIGTFETVYLADFLLARMVTPAVSLTVGIVLWAASRPLGRVLARRLG
jgi:hypothetical protein